MLSIHADGENRHRLESPEGIAVGWIRGRAIGFRGIAGQAEALPAALAGARALNAVLRQAYAGWPRYEPSLDALRLVHDGAYQWVSDGTTPIARLLPTSPDDAPGPRLGLEYVLPSYASEGVAITAAQALARALQAHLVRPPTVPPYDDAA